MSRKDIQLSEDLETNIFEENKMIDNTNLLDVHKIINSFSLKYFNKKLCVDDLEILTLYDKFDDLLSLANSFYVKTKIENCLTTLLKIYDLYPLKTEIFYILGLIFNEYNEIEDAYNCFNKYIEKHKSEEVTMLLFEMSKKMNKMVEALGYINKLQKFNDTKELIYEKLQIYEILYKNNNERAFFYKKTYCDFELMKFDGYNLSIKDFTNILNLYAIKKLINITYNIIKNYKKPDSNYLNEFLNCCIEFKEYKIIKSLIQGEMNSVIRKVQYLIATIDDIDDEVQNEEYAYEIYDNNEAYEEYLLNDNDPLMNSIIKQEYSIDEFIKEDINFIDLTYLHFILFDVLLKKDKIAELSIIIDKLMFMHNIYNFNNNANIRAFNHFCYEDSNSKKLNNEKENFNDYINRGYIPFNMSGTFDIITKKQKILFYHGVILKYQKQIDKAIEIMNYLIEIDPNSEVVKRILNELYLEKGNHSKAKFYDNLCEKKYTNLSRSGVLEVRQKYDEILKLLNSMQYEIFIDESSEFLKKFFTNTNIFKETVSKSKINVNKRKRRSKIKMYNNLNGLSINEWFYLIKTHVFILLDMNNYQKAIDLVINLLDAPFRDKSLNTLIDYFYSIGFLGMRICLISGDIDSFIKIAKKIYLNCYCLVYFFMRFFENYKDNLTFKQLQRNLFRIQLRNRLKITNLELESDVHYDNDDEFENYLKSTNNDKKVKTTKIKNINIESFIDHKYINLNIDDYKNLTEDEKCFFLSTFYPRNLQKKSVKLLEKLLNNDLSTREAIILSTIFLNHSTSKKIKDARKYLKLGFELLFNINAESEMCFKYYNIGRAYHIFGLLGWAEVYYKMAMKEKSEIFIYAKINLLMIYKRNGNDKMYYELHNVKHTDN